VNITSWLDHGVTTSRSLSVEYGYWAPLAMAEVRAKLLSIEERRLLEQHLRHWKRFIQEQSRSTV